MDLQYSDVTPAAPGRPRIPRRPLAVVAALALLVTACSSDGGDAAGPPSTAGTDASEQQGAEASDDTVDDVDGADPLVDPDLVLGDADTTWDVELAADAVVLDQEVVADLVAVEGSSYTFRAGAFDEDEVAEGEVVVVPGVGMGRVTGVAVADEQVTVTTSEANLAEVIEDGTMAWEAPLDLSSGFVPSPEHGGVAEPVASLRRSVAPPPRDGEVRPVGLSMIDAGGRHHAVPTRLDRTGALEWTFEADGNEYAFRLTPTAERIDVEVQATREVAGETTLAYTAAGSLDAVTATGTADFADGELSSIDIEQRELAGTLDLSIAAAGSGNAGIDFELPGLMFKYIVMVGPVPVTIGITTKIIGNITVPAEASATAEASFAYSGSTGFSYEGSSIESTGDLAGLQMSPEPADSAGMIGTAVDAQFGVAFPRFEISVFDQLLVPYIHTGFTIGSSLSWGPVCKRAYAKTTVDVGYDFKVLGVSLHSDKETLFEKERRAEQDGCPDE